MLTLKVQLNRLKCVLLPMDALHLHTHTDTPAHLLFNNADALTNWRIYALNTRTNYIGFFHFSHVTKNVALSRALRFRKTNLLSNGKKRGRFLRLCSM